MAGSTGALDLKRTPAYRARRGAFELVEVPRMRTLQVDGEGDPNTSPRFAEAVGALYPLAYALKSSSKTAGRDFTVMPLEGLWWADDMSSFTVLRDKRRWSWTMLLVVPEWIDGEAFAAAVDRVRSKGSAPAALHDVRLAELDEGLAIQTLHIGPFDDEGPVLQRMHEVEIPDRGLLMTGRHHEIYLSDRRRTAPERLRTILRQPVERT